MKSIHLLLTFTIIICLSLLFTSCSTSGSLKADIPVNTAIIMENFLKAGNYESFNNLFTDGRKNSVSVTQFNDLKKITTNRTGFTHYELLTFSNGKMILIKLTNERMDGEYKIEDVKEIPSEMKSLFE